MVVAQLDMNALLYHIEVVGDGGGPAIISLLDITAPENIAATDEHILFSLADVAPFEPRIGRMKHDGGGMELTSVTPSTADTFVSIHTSGNDAFLVHVHRLGCGRRGG